jgi:hypothetical protein
VDLKKIEETIFRPSKDEEAINERKIPLIRCTDDLLRITLSGGQNA